MSRNPGRHDFLVTSGGFATIWGVATRLSGSKEQANSAWLGSVAFESESAARLPAKDRTRDRKAFRRTELRPSTVCASAPSTEGGLTPGREDLGLADTRAATLEVLVREHQAGVRAFLRVLGINEAWVDDLAQETFLVAYRKLDDWDPRGDAGAWLRGIARHLAANERRKTGRRTRLVAGGLADLLIDQADPEAALPATEWLEALRSCLQELPTPSRELLVRRYADGERAEAMAMRLQTRADTLRQRLLRLRQLMKGCVERKLGENWR